ncbi:MAG: GWxTD domain-containing protein [Bacteroidetes bacterium]|nr:GWxTD domain-containing protein [Bacteroidota bacterium]
MKKDLFLLLLSSFFISSISAQNIEAYFDIARFQLTEENPFIETYLSINGNSVNFINNQGNYQGSVNVSLQFTQNNEVKYYDNYTLLSPEVTDTNNISFNFIDQQRISLPAGSYHFELTIKDANSQSDAFHHPQEIELVNQNNLFSDIQLVDSYSPTTEKNILSKSGYDLIPLVSNFYNTENNKLHFYTEFYQKEDQKILIQTSIRSQETGKTVNELVSTRVKSGKLIPILKSLPIGNLPSGSYLIRAEARNQNNEEIAVQERLFFKASSTPILEDINTEETFVSNINHIDTMRLFIKYLYPIESPRESIYSTNQLNMDNLALMQRYFYKFWKDRDPFQPEAAWEQYLSRVKSANKEFYNGMMPGYKSDRGRVYLAYGDPNSRQQEYFPRSFDPFEVWHYHHIGTERNLRFVFMDNDRFNDYKLIYSNKQGEINDVYWMNRFQDEKNKENDRDLHSPFDYFETPQ